MIPPDHTDITASPPDAAAAPEPAPPEVAVAPEPEALSHSHGLLWTRLISSLLFMGVIILLIFITPYIKAHWRGVEARAEADAAYLTRKAELRAEAEVFLHKRREELKEEAAHAEARLAAMDRKVDLISLGFREVARKVAPRVVNVQNLREPKPGDLGPVAKRALVYDPEKDQKYAHHGQGSGLILSPQLILTNHHVIKGADRLRITFATGAILGLDANVVVSDSITDLAVIRLPNELPADLKDDIQGETPFADSEKDVHVGDWALAVGSPLGYKHTLTQGVISAKGRLLTNILELVELIQTDAAMNPGNSGGPLFDQRGRLMGINVAIASDNGVNQGIGFAIPSNTVRKIVAQLTTLGEVPRGYLGIALEDLPGPKARELFLFDDGAVVVTHVLPGQPAEKAGLRVGDIILKYNKERLYRSQPTRHLRQLIVDTAPGTEMEVEINRAGEARMLRVAIGKRAADLP